MPSDYEKFVGPNWRKYRDAEYAERTQRDFERMCVCFITMVGVAFVLLYWLGYWK